MRLSLVALSFVALLTSPALGQTPQTPPTFESNTIRTWKALHSKILDMARDTVFPDAKLGWKPHPDSRSVIQEFRHVTIGLEYTTALLKGEKFDFAAREKVDESKPQTRASVVQEMEAAIAASYALVEKSPQPLLVGWIDHQAEHYGKLVSNYRSVGIVPPISRPKKSI